MLRRLSSALQSQASANAHDKHQVTAPGGIA